MWDWFLAYGTLVVGAFATLVALYKDADDYIKLSSKRGRLLLASMYIGTLFLLGAGMYQTHQTRVQAYIDKQQAEKDRKKLETDSIQSQQDRAVSKAQLDDARVSLRTLQAKVDKLQTKAETQELSKELLAVKNDLNEAELKLQQPKAKFAATFATPYYDEMPVIDTTAARIPEGLKVNFGVMNTSDIAASRGEIIIKLCDICQFAAEPPGFVRVSTSPETERIRYFDQIQDHEVLEDMSAIVIVPLTAKDFEFGIIVKCGNCEPGKFQPLKARIPPLVSPSLSFNKPKANTRVRKP